jgi:hypothetical protein
MTGHKPFEIEIDRLTRSIENAVSGDSFKTQVLELTSADIRKIKSADWLFEWKVEAKQLNKKIYNLQDRGDHIFMSLIESSKFNRGIKKLYLGVPGNLIAFACKLSLDAGYGGYVSFESKTKLKEHYQKTLGAHLLFGNFMALDTKAAAKLIHQYFSENS